MRFDDDLLAEVNEIIRIPTVFMTKKGVPYEYAPETCKNKMKKSREHVDISVQLLMYLMTNDCDLETIKNFSSGIFTNYINLQRMYSASV